MVSNAINTSTSQNTRTPEFSGKEGVVALTDESLMKFFNDLPDPEKFKELYDQKIAILGMRDRYNDKSQEDDILERVMKEIESKNLEHNKAINAYAEGKDVDELTTLEHVLNVKKEIAINENFKSRKNSKILREFSYLMGEIADTCQKKKNSLVSVIKKLNTLYKTDLFETLGMHYHPDRLDEATLRKIYDAAEQVLSRFENLPALAKENGIDMPGSAVYDGSKKGGFLTIYQALAPKMEREPITGGILVQHQKNEKIGSAKIGEILSQEDPQWGNKEIKYEAYANKKCEALIFEPHQILSGKTEFGIDGGVRIKYKGGFLRGGFSGRSQADDLGMVVATFYKAGLLNEEILQEIQAIAQSPYLEEKMFSLLTQD